VATSTEICVVSYPYPMDVRVSESPSALGRVVLEFVDWLTFAQ